MHDRLEHSQGQLFSPRNVFGLWEEYQNTGAVHVKSGKTHTEEEHANSNDKN